LGWYGNSWGSSGNAQLILSEESGARAIIKLTTAAQILDL
jgi:hypothetical protein